VHPSYAEGHLYTDAHGEQYDFDFASDQFKLEYAYRRDRNVVLPLDAQKAAEKMEESKGLHCWSMCKECGRID
jgi:hypothetical protein